MIDCDDPESSCEVDRGSSFSGIAWGELQRWWSTRTTTMESFLFRL
jgi:hypothetical protein